MKALLCINNPEEMAALTQILRLAHIQSIPTEDLFKALERWSDQPADLVLLILPTDATDLAVTQVRLTTDVPLVVIVDGMSEERCLGLYATGADLVIMRPYSLRLLRAQTENLLRRGLSIPLSQIRPVQVDGLIVDPRTRSVTQAGRPVIILTQREFQLLYLMWLHRGQILTTTQIIDAIWGYTGRGDKNTLRSLINRVRKKMEPDAENPRYLVTIAGVGYRFEEM